MGTKKHTYNEVKQYIENNSNCTLLSTEHENVNALMNLRCECGEKFQTTFKLFKQGKKQCNKCGYKNSNKNRTYTIEYVKKFCKKNKMILLSDEYTNCKTELELICNKCGKPFKTTFDQIKNGNKRYCNECSDTKFKKNMNSFNKKNHDDFVEELSKITNDFEVLDEYVDAKTHLRFKCKKCGNICYKTPDNILNKFRGCSVCNESKGERKIRKWLEDNNINFESQYRFEDCKNIRPLPFDFYLPQYNCCIEYDGEQHYKEVKIFRRPLEEIQKNDKIKTDYCAKHNIKLIRIPYIKLNEVEQILFNMLIPSQAS